MENQDIQLVQQIVRQTVGPMIQDAIRKSNQDRMFDVATIPAHAHTGVDSSRIEASNISNLNVPNITRTFSTTSTGNWATGSTATQNTFIPNASTTDLFDVSSATGAVTFDNPSGYPVNGQILRIRVTSSNSATARSLTFSSSTGGYIGNSPALPSATTTGKTTDLGFQYDTTGSLNKWRLIYSANS